METNGDSRTTQEAALLASGSTNFRGEKTWHVAPTRRVEEPIAEHSGAALEKVSKDMQRDYFMSAEEAVAYGIIDGVLSRRFA